ncbi:MAG: 16S rRNA (guanine(527)-N(7))-methyltransferase RsmG [Clostridia bacterium]|nr:16S rRNA (guanine(527)-N(7))-methyltransferase RsmG [Clostridia bacterium]
MNKETITEKFFAAGIEINGKQAEMFSVYLDMLKIWSEKINLTAVKTEEETVSRHFIESLIPQKSGILFSGADCADVGSGAGFPGIPLAIVRPDIEMTLIESLGKRVDFLDAVIAQTGLKNCRTAKMRSEDAARGEYRERFDIVFARAVARMATLAELCLPLVKTGGKTAAFKSLMAKEEFEEAKNAIILLGGGDAEIYGTAERNLIIIKKLSPTPAKYPRRAGKAASSPIK